MVVGVLRKIVVVVRYICMHICLMCIELNELSYFISYQKKGHLVSRYFFRCSHSQYHLRCILLLVIHQCRWGIPTPTSRLYGFNVQPIRLTPHIPESSESPMNQWTSKPKLEIFMQTKKRISEHRTSKMSYIWTMCT